MCMRIILCTCTSTHNTNKRDYTHVIHLTHRPSSQGWASQCIVIFSGFVKFCWSEFDDFVIVGYWGVHGWLGCLSMYRYTHVALYTLN